MGFWSKVAGIFGRRELAKVTPEEAFVELALGVVQEQPDVLRVESVGGEGMALLVHLKNGVQNTLFLKNTFLETRDASPDEKRERVGVVVGSFAEAAEDRPWAEAISALVPLLRVSTFATGQGLGPELSSLGPLLVSRAFVPGLRIFLGEDQGASMRFVTHEALSEWEQEVEPALAIAFENLQHHVDADVDVESYDKDAGYPIWIVTRDDSYEASRLTLPGYLAGFRDKVLGNPLAIAPHRSLLVVSGDGSDDAIARLCKMAEAEFNASPRSISSALYTVNEAGSVVPFHLPPEHALHAVVERGHYVLQASCYAEQKQLLEERFEKEEVDVFVATFTVFEDEANALASRAVMTRGVATLLPVVDRVVLVNVVDDEQVGKLLMVPWPELLQLAPECFEPAPEHDPPRLRIVGWPSEAVLEQLQRYAAP
jgi:uncharacterized protein YtpQ (UPF0354 family)